jgi:hypothetical protein
MSTILHQALRKLGARWYRLDTHDLHVAKQELHVRGLMLGFIVATALLGCSRNSEKERVADPGTNLTFVLSQDEKQMTRYRFLADGKPASEEVLLGPCDRCGSPVEISRTSDTVRLAWAAGSNQQYVAIDVQSCRVVAHSNQARLPPAIVGCETRH